MEIQFQSDEQRKFYEGKSLDEIIQMIETTIAQIHIMALDAMMGETFYVFMTSANEATKILNFFKAQKEN